MIDLSPARKTPYAHQQVGVDFLYPMGDPSQGRVLPGGTALFDEPGVGKTKQVIDTAFALYRAGVIRRVLIVCPPGVRPVWFDQELGQLSEHGWEGEPFAVTEFHSKVKTWWYGEEPKPRPARFLSWVVTNYEYIRLKDNLARVLGMPGLDQTWLVVDESAAVKSPKAAQTKAVLALRRKCQRITLLNGTPMDTPADLFAQAALLAPTPKGFGSLILGTDSWFHYRARFAVMGGFMRKEIVGWYHEFEPDPLAPANCAVKSCAMKREASVHGWDGLGEIKRRMAPYVLRRIKDECLDLPKRLPAVTIPVPLDPTTWGHYKAMRDDMVAWLDQQTVAVSAQAATKVMRLAQITSGFLGGLLDPQLEEDDQAVLADDGRPAWVPVVRYDTHHYPGGQATTAVQMPPDGAVMLPPREIGREKLDWILTWVRDRLEADPNAKLLIWGRFRLELQRLVDHTKALNLAPVGLIMGGQTPQDRRAALRLLDPKTADPRSPAVVFANPASGGSGLNMAASHQMLYASKDTKLITYQQSLERVDRPGQVHKVWTGHLVATGPDGQRTIDHIVHRALDEKEDLAHKTVDYWRRVLKEGE